MTEWGRTMLRPSCSSPQIPISASYLFVLSLSSPHTHSLHSTTPLLLTLLPNPHNNMSPVIINSSAADTTPVSYPVDEELRNGPIDWWYTCIVA